ncbi:thiamine diphosphokinase [Ignavibacterium sp.]|uniref:thiamine diphosphokinase n=1 Tax=Ignavibacterium sp. TaxID=2651167 RepID=UPI00220A4563|nr:thiamine diphosphokinase [Ignavibacterium sp.]BDQ02105.1 MAG: thiamine pyrophosphokinase [Ignavibacterium sp.]
MKKCIIIANGRAPSKKVINFFEKKGYTTLICADGGANSAKKLGLVPDYIIGDLDSVSPETIKYFSDKSTIIKITRQNDTDVEKCLKFAIKKGFTEALLLGVTGDRLDHTICNLGIVLKFFNKIECNVVAENSFLTPTNESITLKSKPGETISLYAFDSKTKISSDGLKYQLKNSRLPFGERESTSNVATQNEVKLNIRGGIVFIIRDFNFVAKNDLI